MKDTALYNLSGRTIPVNVRIAISGAPAAGQVLVIESFDGVSGAAHWRSEEELKTIRERAAAKPAASTGAAPPVWPPPPKPRAAYS